MKSMKLTTFIFSVLLTAFLIACDLERVKRDNTCTEFKYKDSVVVIDGFYKGQEGVIVGRNSFNACNRGYSVVFTSNTLTETIERKDLMLKQN